MHGAFTDLFQAIKQAIDPIKDVDDLAKAAGDGTLAILEFWSAVHGTDLGPVYDRIRHARTTALNGSFPQSLRQKGLEDMKAIASETLESLTAPPAALETDEAGDESAGEEPEQK